MHGFLVFFSSRTYLLSFYSSSRQMTNSVSASPPPAQLEPVPPSTTSIIPQSQQSWWKDLPQASPPPLIAGNIMHSNESQIGGFSFLLLRVTYLGELRGKQWSLVKKWERNDPQPDTFLSFTALISWLYHTLHFFRHRQQDSSQYIIDIHTRARPS